MLLRFVVQALDEDSGRRRGVIHAAAALRDSYLVSPQDRLALQALAEWFGENLERPSRFAISRRAHAKAQALSWLKVSAVEHVRRMREIVDVLTRYDIQTEMIRTNRPGYIVYEDDHQVTAYPFSDTPT